MTRCQRCGRPLREIGIDTESGQRCNSLSCINCGNTVDEVILENRTRERREYWQRRADQESRDLSRLEKTIQEYELEGVRLSF